MNRRPIENEMVIEFDKIDINLVLENLNSLEVKD